MQHDITVQTAKGDWRVLINDKGETMIVDEFGRCRGHYKDHKTTAVNLTIVLSNRYFKSSPNLDSALRQQAEEFIEADKSSHPAA